MIAGFIVSYWELLVAAGIVILAILAATEPGLPSRRDGGRS